jgi:hypothetical protein
VIIEKTSTLGFNYKLNIEICKLTSESIGSSFIAGLLFPDIRLEKATSGSSSVRYFMPGYDVIEWGGEFPFPLIIAG